MGPFLWILEMVPWKWCWVYFSVIKKINPAPFYQETEREIREAIAFHLEGLRADNLPIPAASSRVEYVEVAA
jgi:hypothetical protein